MQVRRAEAHELDPRKRGENVHVSEPSVSGNVLRVFTVLLGPGLLQQRLQGGEPSSAAEGIEGPVTSAPLVGVNSIGYDSGGIGDVARRVA